MSSQVRPADSVEVQAGPRCQPLQLRDVERQLLPDDLLGLLQHQPARLAGVEGQELLLQVPGALQVGDDLCLHGLADLGNKLKVDQSISFSCLITNLVMISFYFYNWNLRHDQRYDE